MTEKIWTGYILANIVYPRPEGIRFAKMCSKGLAQTKASEIVVLYQ